MRARVVVHHQVDLFGVGSAIVVGYDAQHREGQGVGHLFLVHDPGVEEVAQDEEAKGQHKAQHEGDGVVARFLGGHHAAEAGRIHHLVVGNIAGHGDAGLGAFFEQVVVSGIVEVEAALYAQQLALGLRQLADALLHLAYAAVQVGHQDVGGILDATDVLIEGAARQCNFLVGGLYQRAAFGGRQQHACTFGIQLAQVGKQLVEQAVFNAQGRRAKYLGEVFVLIEVFDQVFVVLALDLL